MTVKNIKILIVDDSATDRKTLLRMIRDRGFSHQIFEANNGEEALEILSQNHKDIGLILLDWQMPKMDGIEFMQKVTNVPAVSSIPIIMVTASSSPEAQSAAKRVNPNLAGYITKPINSEYLINMIVPYLR